MKERRNHKNLIRLIILLSGIFIFAPRYLNALPLPAGDPATTINASAIGEPQFKPPVLALENAQISATEIEEIFDILSNPTASEKIKANALAKLSRIISDAEVGIGLKESIADGLLNIFGDAVLSKGLNFKIPSLLKKIALTPNVSPVKQMAIITGLLNGLSADGLNLDLNVKRRILKVGYALLFAKDNAEEFLIPLDIREAAVDLLLAAFKKENLVPVVEDSTTLKGQISSLLDNEFKDSDPALRDGILKLIGNNPDYNALLKSKIVSLLRRVASAPNFSPEKQKDVAAELINSLSSDHLTFSLKRQILDTLYYFLSAKNTDEEFIIPADIREKGVDLLLPLSTPNLVLTAANAQILEHIIASLSDDNVEDKDALLQEIKTLLSNRITEYNTILKNKIVTFLKNAALTFKISDAGQEQVATGLLNAILSNSPGNYNLNFGMKRKILEAIYHFISAKNTDKEFIIPADIREKMTDLLISAHNKAGLDDISANDDALRRKTAFLLKRIALTPEITATKKETIVDELLGSLTNNAFSNMVKEYSVSVLNSLLVNKEKIGETEDLIVALGLKERIINALLSRGILNNADAAYEVREALVGLFKNAVLISNLDIDTKKAVVEHLLASMDSLPKELSEKVEAALKNISRANNVDTEKIRRPILNKFLAIYNKPDTDLSRKEVFASYVAAIGRADADLKDAIATGLGLNNAKQKEIWNNFNIVALNLTRNFSDEELTQIYHVLDKLSSEKLNGIINPVSLFFAINSGDGTAGWNNLNAAIGIVNGAYNPEDVSGFLKSLCSEIAKAVYDVTLTSAARKEFAADIYEFSALFTEYITDSQTLIKRAKAEADDGNKKLLTQVKIIIRLFDYIAEDNTTKKAYTFKIEIKNENSQITQEVKTLDDDGLPDFSE